MRGTLARNLARDAGYLVVPVTEHGVLRVRDGVLEVGPDASIHAIATLACYRQCELHGAHSAQDVRELVEYFGFRYEPTRAHLKRAGKSGVAYRAVS
jgi:hypothetical protein